MKNKWIQSLYAMVVTLILWELIHLNLHSFVVPNPIQVLGYSVSNMPKIIMHLLFSSKRILLGLGLTLVVGVVLGIAIGENEVLDRLLTPIVYLFYPIPRIAFLPVFMILFGLGDESKIILIFAISVFHLIVNIRDAVKHIPRNINLTARALRLSTRQKLKYVTIPASLPALFTSMKIVVGSSIGALFFAENYATNRGIGYYIMNAWIKANYIEMYSGIVAISLFGIALFRLIDWMNHKLCSWM